MIRHSYCRICPALCGIEVEVDEQRQRIVRVTGDPLHPLSQGFTCSKGRALTEDHNASDRLHSSLKRAQDGWQAIEHLQAIREIAERLTELIDRYGPRSVGVYIGTRGYEVMQLAGATAWLGGIGSPSLYSTYTIDQPGKDIARNLHGSWPAGLQDLASSDVVMFVGNNPVVSATASYIGMPVANARRALRAQRKAGLRIIVIDPRVTETAELADIHLRPIPGQDTTLLAGLIHIIIGNDLYDRDFVARHARGLEELRAAVAPFTPDLVAERCGVPADEVIAAARMFAGAKRGCAIGGTGINMAPHPILAEYLLLCLNTLCGRYMRAGDVVGNPGLLGPGRARQEGARAPRQPWGKGPQPRVRGLSTLYNQMPAAALSDEILMPGDGQLRALIVSGGNPVVALPDAEKAWRAFKNLDLLVALDVRMSQTAALSDYVIGCKMSLERTDVTLASDLRFPRPFAQYAPALVAAPGDLIEEWEFFWMLAQKMGTPWDLRQRIGMPVPIDVTGELSADSKPSTEMLWELLCGGSSIPLAELERHPHGYAPELTPVTIEPGQSTKPNRLELADISMLAELGDVRREPQASPGFPYRLVSRRLSRFHNSWGQTLPKNRERYGGNPLRMHPEDMAREHLSDEDTVRITSSRGSVVATAVAESSLRPGVVAMAHCWGSEQDESELGPLGANTNRLVDNSRGSSQIIGMAVQSAIPVRVAQLGSGSPEEPKT
jgi:anaerobic selenocysteine-containing dehydrogenase